MVQLSTALLHFNKEDLIFSQEVSSLDMRGTKVPQTLEVRNPGTRTTVRFKFVCTDKTDSGIDIAGWWFESVGFPKKMKLLLIND